MALILKQHVQNNVLTISLCDSDLVGKQFEEGKLFLDLSTSYYKGEDVKEDVAKEMLSRARSATVVGKESCDIAKEIYPESSVNSIEDIPFMNIMKF